MIRLEEKYEQAVQFRKRGFTYSEISKIVGVSKSTVSNWLSKKAFSKKIKAENTARAARDNVKRISLVNKARTAERKNKYAEAVRSAETEYKHYKKDPLFTSGLMYWISMRLMREIPATEKIPPDPAFLPQPVPPAALAKEETRVRDLLAKSAKKTPPLKPAK